VFALDVGPCMHPHLEYAARAACDFMIQKVCWGPGNGVGGRQQLALCAAVRCVSFCTEDLPTRLPGLHYWPSSTFSSRMPPPDC